MKPCGYWNIKENIINEAKKYSSRSEFKKKNYHAYYKARINGWLNELLPPFTSNNSHRPSYYWFNKENVFNESKKYTSKNEFKKHCDRAYTVARKNGWLSEMVWLLPKDNAYSSSNCVYAYVDDEYKVAYVGLTCNKERRHKEHLSGLYDGKKIKSAVCSFFAKVGKEIPSPIYLEENLSRTESQIKEKEWLDRYASLGYTMLNKGKTGLGIGCLGRTSKWSKEQFLNEAKKYTTTTELRKNSPTSYAVGRQNGWITETTLIDTSTMTYFTKEECLSKMALYLSISELKKKEYHLYSSLKYNNMLSDAKVFFQNKAQVIYKEKVFNISKKYNLLSDFCKDCKKYYLICKERGWLSEMHWIIDDIEEKTRKDVFERSRQFNYMSDFRRHSKSAYRIAKENGWLSEMVWLGYRPRGGVRYMK